ncbi:MAG: DUF2147 domain-containing protein [Methylocystis sp.]|nr:DUF2147 domain-containing protein [Methylocystis sp.]
MTRTFWICSLKSRKSRRLGRLAMMMSAAAMVFGGVHAAAASTNDPHGIWLRPEGGVQFSFYDCDDGLLCAKVIAAKNPKDQAAIGTVILNGARQTGPNEWKGKFYNTDDGETYDGTITVKTPGELTLKGCLWDVLCSGETWKRMAAAPTTRPTDVLADQAQ